MVLNDCLSDYISQVFTNKILDKKYSSLYDSIRNDFINFKKAYSKMQDSEKYFEFQTKNIERKLRDFMEISNLSFELFGPKNLVSFDSIQLYLGSSYEILMGMKVIYSPLLTYYFQFELNEKEVKLSQIMGDADFFKEICMEK